MSIQIPRLSQWFTPPIVVPIGLTLLLVGYVIYKNFA